MGREISIDIDEESLYKNLHEVINSALNEVYRKHEGIKDIFDLIHQAHCKSALISESLESSESLHQELKERVVMLERRVSLEAERRLGLDDCKRDIKELRAEIALLKVKTLG